MSVNTDLIGSVFDLPRHIDPLTIPAWHDWVPTHTSELEDRRRSLVWGNESRWDSAEAELWVRTLGGGDTRQWGAPADETRDVGSSGNSQINIGANDSANININTNPSTSTRQDRQRASTMEDNWTRIPNILAPDRGGLSTRRAAMLQEMKAETVAEFDEIAADLAEEVKGGCYGEDFERDTLEGDSQLKWSGIGDESVAGTENAGDLLDEVRSGRYSGSSAWSLAGIVDERCQLDWSGSSN